MPALLLALLLAGCASGSSIVPRRAAAAAQPWEIAPSAYPSQRLYRVQYQGPEGRASFKLTLYLERPAQFRMQAADVLGRRLWALQVDAQDRALWLDHRQRTYCWADSASGLTLVPLSRLPLISLPRLLLGRLPVAPAADLRWREDRLSFLDRRGRTWVGTLAAGQPQRWSLLEAEEPIAWWQRVGRGRPAAVFSDRRGQQQVRWEEVVSEPLASPLAPEAAPPGYRQDACPQVAG
ncbi:MAG: hypothetical protein D6696_10980 [Acidobacteria bacterium]|nr:MAG: hypothetical protein D6696_10980 [Acidobacteriota bacterium]